MKAGYQVRVFEAAPQLGEVGAGIQHSANAVKVLHHLGLAEAIDAKAVRPEAYRFRVHSTGEIIQEIPLGETHEARFGAPYVQLHRADIHEILANAVLAEDPDCITLNARVSGYEESDSGVTLTLENRERIEGDALIGADGIKSAVRRQMLGEEAPNFTGQVAWRVVVPTSALPDGLVDPTMDVWCGPGSHAVVYYLRSKQLVNFVGLCRNVDWQEEGWTIKCPWTELKADFEGWHPTIQAIIDAANKEECYRWALNNRQALDHWSTGHVTLLGDACHPTLPYLAQGAVMAIEDAAVLSRCLDKCDDIAEALDLYQRNRIDRTTRIVNESTANKELFQHESVDDLKAAFAERNIDKERTQWLYSYDALNVPLV